MTNILSTAAGKKFLAALRQYHMLDHHESVLCGLSGGADSVALLCLLEAYCVPKGIPLAAVHVNHGIRGEEADRDQAFCEHFCHSKGIPCIVKYADVPAIAASEGIGLEEAARKARYAAFEEAALTMQQELFCKNHSDVPASSRQVRIAVAHHADDNLETVLFHMIRGSGLNGLCGIAPVRDNLIRPLITCRQEEILNLIETLHLPYVTDSTNSDTAYTRNYIRHEILPRLLRINENMEENVTRMCSSLREDMEYLQKAAASLSPNALSAAPDALKKRRLSADYQAALKHNALPMRQLEQTHLETACRLLQEKIPWREASFPGPITFRTLPDGYEFLPCRQAKSADTVPFHLPLRNGTAFLPNGGKIIVTQSEKDIKEIINIYKLSIQQVLYSDKIMGAAYFRNRLPGDKIRLRGMHRDLRKLLSEYGIPPEKRARLPVLCDEDGVLWMPYIGARDECSPKNKQENDTAQLLYLVYCEET